MTTRVSFGLDRAWLLEVPAAEQQSALANGLVVTTVQRRPGPVPVDLQIRFPDGSHLVVPVAADGTFRLRLSSDRQDDFATAAGHLVAIHDATILA